MSQSTAQINHTPLVILGLAMALGPLTALSVGSRYADEETLARAQAGAENIRRMELQAAMVNPAQAPVQAPAEEAEQAYASAVSANNESGS